MRAFGWLVALSVAACTTTDTGEQKPQKTEPPAAHQIVSLLAYVEKDYGGAVSGGVVQDEGEWEEQKVFINDMLEISQSLPPAELRGGGDVQSRLKEIGAQIQAKAKEDVVAGACRSLKDDLVKSFSLTLSPARPPTPGRGAELFQIMCSDCHGKDGKAQTPRRAQLKIPPANFFDDDVMGPLSPYRAFDILSFGVGDMPSFELVSTEDRWALAFYVFELRHAGKEAKPEALNNLPAGIPRTATTLAKTSDKELLEQLTAAGLSESAQQEALTALRVIAPYTKQDAAEALSLTRRFLAKSKDAFEDGDTKGAFDNALKAYLEGFEGVEMKLRARDAELVAEAESLNLALRAAIKENDTEKVEGLFADLSALLDRAERILSDGAGGFAFAFFGSLIILLREGIEAALVIAALLALLGKLDRKDAKKYVHAGWLSALALGGLSFLLVQGLLSMSTTSRDLMEGVVALFAAVVMFFTSYWLISKSEAQRWVAYLRKTVEGKLSSGNLLALSGVAFLAVFREALETMLFYQALLLDPNATVGAVLLGVLVGLLALIVVIWGIFRVGKKLPIQKFFGISGALLYAMTVIFASAGLHELQEIGYLPSWTVPFIRVDILAIYPDALTLGVQLALIGAAIFAFVLPRLKNKNTPSANQPTEAKQAAEAK